MVIELLRRMQDTQTFLELAALELRRIAEQSPDIAAELQQVAQKSRPRRRIWLAGTAIDPGSRLLLQQRKGDQLLYIVEVAFGAGSLAHELNQMRTWLDHMTFQAIGFRQVPGAHSCRVDFEREQDARAFAQAFSGRVLNRAAA